MLRVPLNMGKSAAYCQGTVGEFLQCLQCLPEIYGSHQQILFQPIAIESHGAFSESAPLLPRHFGRTLDWYLRRLARDVISIPKTLGHCTAFQFGLNTRVLCFCRWRTRPLAIPTFDISLMFLALGICTTKGEKVMIMIVVCSSCGQNNGDH